MPIGTYASAVVTTIAAPTFPVISSSNFEVGASLGAANAIPAPSGVVSGNLLVAFCASDNPSTTDITASTGWTQVFHTVQGANVIKCACFARIADGGANDALALSGASAQDYVATILRIINHGVAVIATDIKQTTTSASTGNTDPPSLDAGSSRSWMWLAVNCLDLTTSNTITAVPASYSSVVNQVSASSTSSVALCVASRENLIQTENPGTFTNNPTTRAWIGATVAIPEYVVPTVPGAPTAVSGTAGNGQVALTWTAPAVSGGAAITDYTVQYALESAPTSWTTFSHSASTATAITVTGLTNGSAYIFQVAAVNSVGTGSYSTASSAVTPVAPGGVTPSVVGNQFGGGGTESYFGKPAGGATGDQYLFAYNAQDWATSPPSNIQMTGFTATPTTPVGGNNTHSMFFYKAWASGDPAYMEVLNRAGHWNYMDSLLVRGWSGSAPVLGSPHWQGSGSTHVANGMTGLPANSLAVLFMADYDGWTGIAIADGTWTLIHRGQFNAAPIWVKDMTAGGDVTGPTITGASTVGISMSLMCYIAG